MIMNWCIVILLCINLIILQEGLKYFDKRLLIKKNTANLKTYECFKDKVFNIIH